MSEQPSKKRSAPNLAPPVTHKGVTYKAVVEAAPTWGSDPLPASAEGSLVATDAASGVELWRAKLYEIQYDPEMERDKQEVYVEKLAFNLMRTRLTATDEKHRRFEVDLSTHAVRAH